MLIPRLSPTEQQGHQSVSTGFRLFPRLVEIEHQRSRSLPACTVSCAVFVRATSMRNVVDVWFILERVTGSIIPFRLKKFEGVEIVWLERLFRLFKSFS